MAPSRRPPTMTWTTTMDAPSAPTALRLYCAVPRTATAICQCRLLGPNHIARFALKLDEISRGLDVLPGLVVSRQSQTVRRRPHLSIVRGTPICHGAALFGRRLR